MNRITVSGILSLVIITPALLFTMINVTNGQITTAYPPNIAFRVLLIIIAITAAVLPFIKRVKGSEFVPFINGILLATTLSLTLNFTFDRFFPNGNPDMGYVPLLSFLVIVIVVIMFIINLITKKPVFGDSTFGRIALFTAIAIIAFTALFQFVIIKPFAVNGFYDLDLYLFIEITFLSAMYSGALWIGSLNIKENNNKILPFIALGLVVTSEIIWAVLGRGGAA